MHNDILVELKKTALPTLALMLLSTAMIGRYIGKVEAGGTIYIRADGSIDGTTDIVTVDNVTYTFTDNIYDSIVVEKSNIIIDGNRHTLNGSSLGPAMGFNLTSVSNVTITNTNIEGFHNAPSICLFQASNNTISGNNITGFYGISLSSSTNNSIYGNNIRAYHMLCPYSVGISLSSSNSNCIYANEIVWSDYGIRFESSSSNCIFGNTIAGNGYGISLSSSSNNSIYGNYIGGNYNYNIGIWSSSGNRFYHNTIGATIGPNPAVGLNNSTDTWDDGYPSGGNYWGGGGLILPTDVDVKSGPYQNKTGSDGIVDTPHVIDANNTDNYPLMGMFSDFTVWDNETYHITTICSFTISDFNWGYRMNITGTWEKALYFNVFGPEDIVGFCRIMIPRAFMEGPYAVLFTNEVNSTELPISNSTHVFLYITYNHSGHVMIVPEFRSFFILPLFMITTLLAVILYRRQLKKRSTSAPIRNF